MVYLLILIGVLFGNETKEDESNLVKVNILQSDLYHHNQPIYLLFQLNIKDKWHTYWRNPGDSGLPTDIEIETQDNVEVSEIIWPQIPEKIPFDDLANYGFSNKQYLILKINPDNGEKDINLKAKISWLVCKEKCLAQDTSISFSIKYNQQIKKTESNNLIQSLLSNVPKLKSFKNQKAIQEDEKVILSFDEIISPEVQFFPFEGGVFVHGAEQKIILEKNSMKIILPLDEFRIEIPENLVGILVYDNKAVEISVPIELSK